MTRNREGGGEWGFEGATFQDAGTIRFRGEMAERFNAAVLKTVEGHTSGGSNPSLSATIPHLR